jgi:hypothetical protein
MKGNENEIEIIKISRQLTPKHRAELLSMAYKALEDQKSACEPAGPDGAVGINALLLQPQEYSCKK